MSEDDEPADITIALNEPSWAKDPGNGVPLDHESVGFSFEWIAGPYEPEPPEPSPEAPPQSITGGEPIEFARFYILGAYDHTGKPYLTTWDGPPTTGAIVYGVTLNKVPYWKASPPEGARLESVPGGADPHEHARQTNGIYVIGWKLDEEGRPIGPPDKCSECYGRREIRIQLHERKGDVNYYWDETVACSKCTKAENPAPDE